MTGPEEELRKSWSEQGVPPERQDEIIAQVKAKAQPGAKVGPFTIPYRSELTPAGEQSVIPGCEADAPETGKKQMDLF